MAGYDALDTRWRQAKHVVFAGAMPVTDIGTDISVIYGIFDDFTADSGAHWYGYCSIASLALPTLGRLFAVVLEAFY